MDGADVVVSAGTAKSLARGEGARFALTARRVAWIAFVAAFLLGVLRRPDAIIRPKFFLEDATFFGDAQAGRPIWELYAGYLHVVPRLVATLQAALDPHAAALLGTVVSLAVSAGVAAFVASDRMRSILPEPTLRFAIAMLVVLIPQGGEALGAPSHLSWYLALFLVARVFADPPRSRLASWVDRAAVVIAALSGPLGIVLAPLYWFRARALFAWIAVPSAIQLALLIASPRAGGSYPLPLLVDIIATRVIGQSIVGQVFQKVLEFRLPLAAGLLALLAVAFRVIPRSLWPHGAYLLVVPLAVGLMGNPDKSEIMLSPWAAQRYFMVAGFVLGAAVLLAAWRRRGPAQVALAGLFAGGVVVSFMLAPRP